MYLISLLNKEDFTLLVPCLNLSILSLRSGGAEIKLGRVFIKSLINSIKDEKI